MEIEQLTEAPALLGEGPLWDEREQCLYWVDSVAGTLFRRDAGGHSRHWPLGTMVGSLTLCDTPGLAIIALKTGLHWLDLDSGALTPIIDPEAEQPATRINDGKVDRDGNFVVGTMGIKVRDPALGSLYRLNAALELERLLDNVAVANGPCFSPDGGTFYFNEGRRQIVAFDYQADGALTSRRVFFDGAAHDTGSDGATVDAEGNVWTALSGSGEIACIAPDGRLLERIAMPVRLPSSVMFGGPDLTELYVTSISDSGNRRSDEPGAGCLLRITGLGARGLAEPRFRGSAP